MPVESAVFSREQFEASRVTQALEENVAADPVLIDEPAPEPTQVRDGGRTRDSWADLSLETLPELERELKLSPLQRERIERWLAWQKESQEAEFDEYGIIGQAIHDAVRAELDYFQAQEFDRGWNARGYDIGIDLINRPPEVSWAVTDQEVGNPVYVTREGARLEVYDLKAQTFHTFMRMDPITRAGLDPISAQIIRPAVEAMDLLEADLLDCLPFKGQQVFRMTQSKK